MSPAEAFLRIVMSTPEQIESQRVNLNAAADALRSCAWALQEALKQ